MSLLGSRRFLGDYLGVGNKGGPGEMIRMVQRIQRFRGRAFLLPCGALGFQVWTFQQACASDFLVSDEAKTCVHCGTEHCQQPASHCVRADHPCWSDQDSSAPRTSRMTGSRWLSVAQEPDPLLNCVFKTEFFTHLTNVLRGSLTLKVGESIEYNKKPGKLAMVKAVKDPACWECRQLQE